ncbi:MAG: Gfo/Idh/MocA family protein, partial [Pirellulaceae bacterium]
MAVAARVLIVGTGSIGERHVRCFHRTGRADVAICEIDETLRRQISDRYGIQQIYADLGAALQGSFDAAVICTPAHLHIPMALELARAGVHLLIEKPLSTSVEGVAALRETLQARNLLAAVAYVYRAHPALAAMREAIADGRFGCPVQLVAVCGQHFPAYRPAYRQIYYKDRATGGGAVQDALTHIFNAGEWLVGAIDRVVADAAHQVLEGVDVEDTVHVIARHRDVLGCYSLNQHQAPNEVTITVVGQRGTARFESHHQRWRWMTDAGGAWTDEPLDELSRDAMFELQAEQFLDALQGTEPPLCSLDEALQTLHVNQAVLRSIDNRRWE